jgi:hypothetical protein
VADASRCRRSAEFIPPGKPFLFSDDYRPVLSPFLPRLVDLPRYNWYSASNLLMKATQYHARLHILLARDAKTGIIIRRGPSKLVCTIGWDRTNDTFQLGQWMRGRIQERHCDLSPDGVHFLYSGSNYRKDSDVGGTWTAISRAPYIKAIGLWANGASYGGGLFTSNSSFWIVKSLVGYEEKQFPEGFEEVRCDRWFGGWGALTLELYSMRLERDGWFPVRRTDFSKYSAEVVFERPLSSGWTLEKTAHRTEEALHRLGTHFDTHRLVHRENDIAVDCPDWEWADLDGERLVWSEHGFLCAAEISSQGLVGTRRLFDFTPMGFEAIAAPY